MKTIEYFLNEEAAYIKSREGEAELEWNEDAQEFMSADMNNHLSFLEDNWFHTLYGKIQTNTDNILDILEQFKLSFAEGVMLLAFLGHLSKYFRDDYYDVFHGVPILVRDMQECLYSAIQKAPLYEGGIFISFLRYGR